MEKPGRLNPSPCTCKPAGPPDAHVLRGEIASPLEDCSGSTRDEKPESNNAIHNNFLLGMRPLMRKVNLAQPTAASNLRATCRTFPWATALSAVTTSPRNNNVTSQSVLTTQPPSDSSERRPRSSSFYLTLASNLTRSKRWAHWTSARSSVPATGMDLEEWNRTTTSRTSTVKEKTRVLSPYYGPCSVPVSDLHDDENWRPVRINSLNENMVKAEERSHGDLGFHEEQDFYHGEVSSEETQRLFKRHGGLSGLCLVRDCSSVPGHYQLMVWDGVSGTRYKIQFAMHHGEGVFLLAGSGKAPFNSMADILLYLYSTRRKLRARPTMYIPRLTEQDKHKVYRHHFIGTEA